MLDIGSSELLLIVIVAVVVIGPKDLPRVLYKLGQIIGKGRAMTRHFRAGIDEMIRQAEIEDMEKKWAADNARIMAQTQETAPVATASHGAEVPPPVLPAPETPAVQPVPASPVSAAPVEEAHHFRTDPGPVVEEAPVPDAGPSERAKSQDGSAA